MTKKIIVQTCLECPNRSNENSLPYCNAVNPHRGLPFTTRDVGRVTEVIPTGSIPEWCALDEAAVGPSELNDGLGKPDTYWSVTDPDCSYDCPDDIDIVGYMPLGTEYELTAAWYQTKKFKVVKVPDENSDDYEVEEIPSTY